MAADSAAARSNMVERQVRINDVTDVRIHDAMRAIDRAAFATEGKGYLAYADTEIPYAPGRWLLKPRDVAKLLQALRPQRAFHHLLVGRRGACGDNPSRTARTRGARPCGAEIVGLYGHAVIIRVPDGWTPAARTMAAGQRAGVACRR